MNLKTFCLNKKIQYEEILLRDPMINKIYEINNPEQKQIIGVPDGCVDIQAFWKDSSVSVYVCGSFQRAAISDTGSYEKCLGIKFNPGVMMECFRGSMDEIVDHKIDLSCFLNNASGFCELISEEKSMAEKVPRIRQFLKNEKMMERHMIVEYLFDTMFHRKMGVPIQNMTEELGYSQRQVERIFKEHTGFTVKKYEGILRTQYALHLIKEENMNQDMLLEKLGYYDQAHFIHEFKRYTMQTPGNYMKNQNKIVIV